MTIRVVTGPPCSGKSTYVLEHAAVGDVVVDFDRIASALGYPGEHVDWSEEVPHPARVAAMIARASLIKAVAGGRVDGDVWIVDAAPDMGSVATYAKLGADLVPLDPGQVECRRRAIADGRPAATLKEIDRWYAPVGITSADWPPVGVTSTEW